MSKTDILEKMRASYRAGDLKSLKRQFMIGQWCLTDEDKQKISAAIVKLEQQPPPKPLNPIIEEALRLLGGRIVDE